MFSSPDPQKWYLYGPADTDYHYESVGYWLAYDADPVGEAAILLSDQWPFWNHDSGYELSEMVQEVWEKKLEAGDTPSPQLERMCWYEVMTSTIWPPGGLYPVPYFES